MDHSPVAGLQKVKWSSAITSLLRDGQRQYPSPVNTRWVFAARGDEGCALALALRRGSGPLCPLRRERRDCRARARARPWRLRQPPLSQPHPALILHSSESRARPPPSALARRAPDTPRLRAAFATLRSRSTRRSRPPSPTRTRTSTRPSRSRRRRSRPAPRAAPTFAPTFCVDADGGPTDFWDDAAARITNGVTLATTATTTTTTSPPVTLLRLRRRVFLDHRRALHIAHLHARTDILGKADARADVLPRHGQRGDRLLGRRHCGNYDPGDNCGLYDDEDFTAADLCCACGGGFFSNTEEPSASPTSPSCYELDNAEEVSARQYYEMWCTDLSQDSCSGLSYSHDDLSSENISFAQVEQHMIDETSARVRLVLVRGAHQRMTRTVLLRWWRRFDYLHWLRLVQAGWL